MRNFRSSENILSQLKEIPDSAAPQGETTHDQMLDPSQIPPPVRYLLAVIIQIQDLKKAANALSESGLPVFQLPSTGAFLGQDNGTLLIGLREGQEETAIEVIKQNCCQRQVYLTAPMDGAPLPAPVATPITVGGALIFHIEVEHFEEF